jgi:predicted ATPase with chaperone activity
MHEINRNVFHPAEAATLEQTGLSRGLILDLVLKYAFFEGTITLAELIEKSKLGTAVVQALYRHLHDQRLCESRSYENRITLNSKGRDLAEVALKKSQYLGPAPVTLADYRRAVSAQRLRQTLTADSLKSALKDLVLPETVLKELGAALLSGGTIMLYGSTGNGKTSVAERLPRLYDDLVYVPYGVEVSGQILTVFDPLVHRPEGARQNCADPRWVACRRPMVKVGGELRVDMLDVRADEVTRVCTAPIQMKANNGILLIDDFGRQRITPRELLNRWIVPLDRGADVLSLPSGGSFEIPFEALVVFATNLSLSDLAEDAFMRRLKNKIKIEPLREDLFMELLRRVCRENQVECPPEMEEYLTAECLKHSPNALRACFPRDLMAIVRGIADFEHRKPSFDRRSIDEAMRVYFVR